MVPHTMVRTVQDERARQIEELARIGASRGPRGRRGRPVMRRRPRLRPRTPGPLGGVTPDQAVAVPGRPMAFTSRYSSKPSTPFSRPSPDWR